MTEYQKKYMIVRMFDNTRRPIEIKKRGLTKEQALAHVNSGKAVGSGWTEGFTAED